MYVMRVQHMICIHIPYIHRSVGDNVGDVAGMGADLFGSFAESTCAALLIAAQVRVLGLVCYVCMYVL